MKKIISFLAAALLLFAMPACSTSGSSSAGSATLSSQSGSAAGGSSGDAQSAADSGNSTGNQTNPSAAPEGTSSKAQAVAPSNSGATTPSSSAPAQPTSVRVTIPEGFTLSQIGDRLEAKGVCKKADLIKAANTYDFTANYPLIKSLGSSPNRAFKVEGYLFPNTYDFNLNKPAQDALGVMLRGSKSKIGGNYSYPGMTTDQIVTLASIIEKESGKTSEMQKISAVFHNRLKAKMRLQADVTINYVEKYLKPLITGDVNRYNSYYNTYKCSALPTGPICNPGANSLYAATHPQTAAVAATATSTEFTPDATYFAADSNGNYYYATSLAQHKANLAKGGIIEGGGMQ